MRLGNRGEDIAARYLRKHGHHILGYNDRSQFGEIDLVAQEGKTIVFVEVKTRRDQKRGGPLEAVTPQKQAKIVKQAMRFLKRQKLLGNPCRFDVIGIEWPSEEQPKITHIRNAFDASDHSSFYS
ncbi:Endonuclease [Planctomycetales bacterium 10988]|nr:Endonuclease [Planctomycetales bacterium 10988]